MYKKIYNGNLKDAYRTDVFKFAHVESCGVHIGAQHITLRERGRSDWHLLYVESGEMLFEVDGAPVTVGAGGCVIYPPRIPQKYEQVSGVCYWIHFSGKCIDEIVMDAGLLSKCVIHADGASEEIVRIFERMLYRYAANQPHRHLTLASDLLCLLSEIGRIARDEEVDRDGRLRDVIVHMHKHYGEEIDLDRYAAMVGLSLGRFVHLFKESMGTSPYAYVLELRLTQAAELLLSTDRSVAQIAYAVGFSDPLYFSRSFKRRYQLSPLVFRKELGHHPQNRVRTTGCD